MPARPLPQSMSAGSTSSTSYAKTLPPPPPSSPLKPSTTQFLGPTSPTEKTATSGGASSRPSTPARASLFAPVLDDSPLDDRGQRAPIRRRAYFADVVLPSSAASYELSDPVAFLLSTLGDSLSAPPFPPGQDESSNPKLAAAAAAAASSSTPGRMVRAGSVDPSSSESAAGVSTPDPRKLEPLVTELLTTERTYVRRLRALKTTYADPLRIFAKDPSMAIIPSYNATALFGNLDVLLAVNEAFLADLERIGAGGGPLGIGDVALRHFRDLRAFDCYRHYYDACEDAQAMLSDMVARRRNFAEFVAASKFKTEGIANVGLKELLMEPVQRIPRYTMMWALMVRYMDPLDPQRARLLEASEIARAIAGSEKDEVTRRGMVLMGLGKSVDGFPAELINNNRDYLSSLDVEDTALTTSSSSATDPTSPASTHPSSASLNETLILFSDRLLLAKRPSASSSGRRITGLDDLPRLWKGGVGASSSIGSGPSGKRATTPGGGGSGWESDGGARGASNGDAGGVKERSISCKGLTVLTDLVAVDLGGSAFSLSIPHALSHAPPSSSSSAPAWTRPHRHLVVCPPSQPASSARHTPNGSDPRRAKADKQRFLANFWAAQALVRARKGGSRVVIGREEEALFSVQGQPPIGEKGRGYLNVWNRSDWDEDSSKARVVVQVVDESGSDAFLGWESDRMRRVQLVFRIQPLAGGLSRVGFRTREVEERDEILPTTAVYANLLQTIHRLCIYIPRLDFPRSAPPTPTHVGSSVRRPILGLDALSRNLFGSTSSRGAESSLSSSAASHKRTRSAASKASSSAAATDYSSSVTRSTVSSLAYSKLSDSADCDAHARLGRHSREGSGGQPTASTSKSPTTSPHRRQSPGGMRMSRSGSTSPFSTRKPVPIDEELSGGRARPSENDEDEDMDGDLGRQLELARKNSESARGSLADHNLWGSQAGLSGATHVDEVEPPQEVLRRPQTPPLDVAMRRAQSPPIGDDVFGGSLRAKSPGTADRRPYGPRGQTPSRAATPSRTTTPSRATTPARLETPLVSTAPLRLFPDSPVADRAHLGLGAIPSPSQPPSASKASRSRRVSDEWRNARPSPVAAVPSTTPGPFEETPDSPSSVSSGQKRDRRGSVDEPSPVLDKKIRRASDGRSPLSPIRNASTAPQLPPVTGLSIRKSSLPSGGAPSQAPRKVSGAGVTKRIFEAEKAATSAHVEDRILGAARATQEDVSDCRRSSKRIKLEVEGLRAHFSRNIGQKDRLQRVGETGSLPRSPPSRNISIRANNRHTEGRDVYEPIASAAALEDFAPSRPSSSRKAGVDVAFLTDWCAVLEGLIGELDGGLSRAAVNSDRLGADVMGLIEAKRLSAVDVTALKAKLVEAKQQIDQAHRLTDAQKLELLDAKNENAALYEAFNEELEQMYADMTLPGAEANMAMKRDLQMTKADRNALRLENATLKRELEHAAYEKDRYERVLRDRGLL